MTVKQFAGASSAERHQSWQELPWSTINAHVFRLQMRIAKAEREGKIGKVKSLQRLLTSSFYGKCLAVKRVTSNVGAKTPGVDGITWKTPESKMLAVSSLSRKAYKPLPLRRIYIPKKSGKLRPLSIPVMKCRAMKALWHAALVPIAEERADTNAYGFRPKRSAHDAIEQCFCALSNRHAANWVLEGDIKACFDRINHEWLLENIPMDKVILKKFLKSDYVEVKQSLYRKHPRKGRWWIMKKYFTTVGDNNWRFHCIVNECSIFVFKQGLVDTEVRVIDAVASTNVQDNQFLIQHKINGFIKVGR